MGEKKEQLPSAHEAVSKEDSSKPKRGRPKVSPLDRKTQKRLSVQKYRQAKRQGDEVPIEIYLPKDWHDWLVNSQGANLREVAVEAFAEWLEKRGYAARDTPSNANSFAGERGRLEQPHSSPAK